MPEMANFFDLNAVSMPELVEMDTTPAFSTPLIATPAQDSTMSGQYEPTLCPAHGSGCICHGFLGDFGYAEPPTAPEASGDYFPIGEQMGQDFSSWLPRYFKPEKPCDYCKNKNLECFTFFNQSGKLTCSPCNSLFRLCSWDQPEGHVLKPRGFMDTLDLVPEDQCKETGGLTGLKTMKSLSRNTLAEHNAETAKKAGSRFPKAAVKILRDWFEQHADNPYPNDQQKEELRVVTGLTIAQILNWFANTRRRGRAPRLSRDPSPSTMARTQPIEIGTPNHKSWEYMNPLERWQISPPENEPAPITAIAKAVAHTDLEPRNDGPTSGSWSAKHKSSAGSTSGSFSVFRAPSTTSLETIGTSGQLSNGSSFGSGWSHGSRNSFGSFNGIKKDRRRRRRTNAAAVAARTNPAENARRMFQCTFCCDTFKNKYDWTRHEKSLHLSLEKYICAPLGPVVTDPSTGHRRCVYCDTPNPTAEHTHQHNHAVCEDKGIANRTFYRKDHLRQHLRLIHGVPLIDSMDTWKSAPHHIRSRCGFCAQTFTNWSDRCDHLAKHFREGARMRDWRGSRGLDPAVAALVTDAMPSFLIGMESTTPVPFSATDDVSLQHHTQHATRIDSLVQPVVEGQPRSHPPNRATCWEILTVSLGAFVREQLALGHDVTDQVLQREARRILFGEDDDGWNQTAADNEEWMSLFKQAHGLAGHDQLADDTLLFEAGLKPSQEGKPSGVGVRAGSRERLDGIRELDGLGLFGLGTGKKRGVQAGTGMGMHCPMTSLPTLEHSTSTSSNQSPANQSYNFLNLNLNLPTTTATFTDPSTTLAFTTAPLVATSAPLMDTSGLMNIDLSCMDPSFMDMTNLNIDSLMGMMSGQEYPAVSAAATGSGLGQGQALDGVFDMGMDDMFWSMD